jgi:hypothetical protein
VKWYDFDVLFAKLLTYLIIIEGRVFMAIGYRISEPSGKLTILSAETRDELVDRGGAI